MKMLLDLPSELLASIFHYLEDEDFSTARLAARPLEESALTLFGRRFFRKKGYLVTTPSLDVLEQVANSPKLRKYVTHVWFAPDVFLYITPSCAPEPQVDCDDAEDESEDERVHINYRPDLLSSEDQRRWDAYCDCMEDHTNLLGRDALPLQRRLETIFAKLPNLKILGMRRSEDHHPWGWRRLQNQVGEDPRVIGEIPRGQADSLSGPTNLFAAVVSATAIAGVRLQRFYNDLIEIDNIPAQRLPEAVLRKALGSMLYLELNTILANLRPHSSPYYRALEDEKHYGDGLLKVLQAAAPTLLELGMQNFPEMRKPWAPLSGSWYDERAKQYQSIIFRRVAENVRLEHLTRIKLEKIMATPSTLETFLRPSSAHLTSIKLRYVRLIYPEEDNARPWESIFAFFQTSMPKLEYLLLYNLLHMMGGISFVEQSHRPSASLPQYIDDDGHLATVEPSGIGSFEDYEHLTLEAKGKDEVARKLEEVTERHWYQGNVYTYAMDDDVWHTDTSDEEW